jgi:hypothetical protein
LQLTLSGAEHRVVARQRELQEAESAVRHEADQLAASKQAAKSGGERAKE